MAKLFYFWHFGLLFINNEVVKFRDPAFFTGSLFLNIFFWHIHGDSLNFAMCDLMEIWDDEKNIFFPYLGTQGGGGEIIELHNIYPWKKTFFWVMNSKIFAGGLHPPPLLQTYSLKITFKKTGEKALIKHHFWVINSRSHYTMFRFQYPYYHYHPSSYKWTPCSA